jgi:hypothetical protein
MFSALGVFCASAPRYAAPPYLPLSSLLDRLADRHDVRRRFDSISREMCRQILR